MRKHLNLMGRIRFFMAGIVFFTAGCATIKEATLMSGFEKVSQAYELVLLDSDFETAHGFIDPEVVREEVDFTMYKDIKIVEYHVKQGQVSNDKNMINQIAEVKYYRLDSLIVRTVRYKQLWKYNDVKKSWLLQTGLPELK